MRHGGKESGSMDGFWFKFNLLTEIKHMDMRVYTGKNYGRGRKNSHLHSLTKTVNLISD